LAGIKPDNGGLADGWELSQWETTIDAMANLFSEDNSSFDKEKFLKACTPKEPKH
jgi:hypothetical protein